MGGRYQKCRVWGRLRYRVSRLEPVSSLKIVRRRKHGCRLAGRPRYELIAHNGTTWSRGHWGTMGGPVLGRPRTGPRTTYSACKDLENVGVLFQTCAAYYLKINKKWVLLSILSVKSLCTCMCPYTPAYAYLGVQLRITLVPSPWN